MKKQSATEDAFRAIKAIRDMPEKPGAEAELALFLQHKSNHVIAAAAGTIEKQELTALAPAMSDVFLELMKKSATKDPGCKALIALAQALVAMDYPAAPQFFAGIKHIQMEGSFGPPVDAAAPLRGLCAQGLVRMSHPEAMAECVPLLVDKETAARVGAIRALGDSGKHEAMLLLRLKALTGDRVDEVTGECLATLLRLDPKGSLGFVASFFWSTAEGVAARAAVAMGESRVAGAFPLLTEAWSAIADAEMRRTLLLAIALLRLDEGIEFLLERVREEPENSAGIAVTALAIYGRDEAIRGRVLGIVEERGARSLRDVFNREFAK